MQSYFKFDKNAVRAVFLIRAVHLTIGNNCIGKYRTHDLKKKIKHIFICLFLQLW